MTYRSAYPGKKLLRCGLPPISAAADAGILLKCTQNTDIDKTTYSGKKPVLHV
jgi:hypothetical protein